MRADPSVNFEQIDKDGDATVVTQARMRAMLLCQEAITYMLDKPGKATSLLARATEIDPEFWYAHFSLGTHQFEHRNKVEAVAALERALLLDPDDIDTIKALDRARNMSAIEAVTFKATRAVESTRDTGIKTINFFILIWNIFVTIFNIITLPLRIPARIFFWLFGVADRFWK